MKEERSSVFYITLGIAMISTTLFLLAVRYGWLGLPDTAAMGEFCEAWKEGPIREVVNTWSNLAFIAAGLYIAWELMRGTYGQNENSFTQNSFYATFFPCLVVLIGPSSMALHATNTLPGQFFDRLSMYLVASFLMSYSAQRFFNLKPFHFVFLFLFSVLGAVWAHFQNFYFLFDYSGRAVFALYMVITIVVESLNVYRQKWHRQTRWLLFSVASLAVAFTIWNLSKTGAPLCDPASLIQGHGIWEVLSAVALYFLFRYYVSETRILK